MELEDYCEVMKLTPSLSGYGYIADYHSSALILKSGSIDWCCMPRIDSRSCFGRLLGWEQGGEATGSQAMAIEVAETLSSIAG